MTSFWTILTSVAPILAPIISIILAVLGKILWNHEKRITQNEQSVTRHGRSLFGDDDDSQQAGATEDLNALTDRVDEVEEEVAEIRRRIND